MHTCRVETIHVYRWTYLVIIRAIPRILVNAWKSARQSTEFSEVARPRNQASRRAVTSARVRCRGPFLRRVGADEYPALRGKPQIETAIWRYSTWIDESTDACSVSARLKETIYSSLRDDRPGWIIIGVNAPAWTDFHGDVSSEVNNEIKVLVSTDERNKNVS